MKDVKVSVIVPCYGVEKYLDRCLNSIVNQTLRDIEIILVDDKSPDGVPEMCDKWAKKDSRIRVIHKEVNEGLGFARNSGLDVAIGDYIAFVDSDDFVEVDMYEELYEEAVSSDADVAFCNFYTELSNRQWIENIDVVNRKEWDNEKAKSFLVDMISCNPKESKVSAYRMSVWHSIYKRSIIEATEENGRIRFHSERDILSEDLPFQIDFLLRSRKVVYIPNCMYRYCLNNTSLTNSFDTSKFDRMNNLYELLIRQTKNITNIQKRIDYFYINYSRGRIQDLMQSKTSDKSKWVLKACDSLRDYGITSRFDMLSLRIDRLIFYFCMKYKLFIPIMLICKLMSYKRTK